MNPISKRLTIDVTQEDIHHGTPGDCEDCPVALAIRRIFPNCSVKVEGDVIEIDGSTVGAPAMVESFVDDFDRKYNDFVNTFYSSFEKFFDDYDEWRDGFEPFSFVLPVKGWK